MLILGTGREDIDLGPIPWQECEVCGVKDPFCLQPFRLHFLYRYEHLFFVFGNARARSYVIVCETCQTPYRIPRKVAWKLARIDRDPIPFRRQYGCLLVFIIFFLIAAVSLFFEQSPW